MGWLLKTDRADQISNLLGSVAWASSAVMPSTFGTIQFVLAPSTKLLVVRFGAKETANADNCFGTAVRLALLSEEGGWCRYV